MVWSYFKIKFSQVVLTLLFTEFEGAKACSNWKGKKVHLMCNLMSFLKSF